MIIIFRANEIFSELKKANIRVHLDNRDNYTPGWKFNNWEMKGVPLRIEIGPKDLQKGEVRLVKRNDGVKF
ncbi:MAG: His/Gly/Thr/Pro-type tRNA ligase C-terminal domain-containing protein [bacterium]